MNRRIFVFGSNLGGFHSGGAARAAFVDHGAIWGLAEGLQGNSYAIPTCDRDIRPLPLEEIRKAVIRFKAFASPHPELTFNVTRIGCGIAGFTDEEIAPMFYGSPQNCELPERWKEIAETLEVA